MRARKRILEHRKLRNEVTKVIDHHSAHWLVPLVVFLASYSGQQVLGQGSSGHAAPTHAAEDLYLQLRGVGLDKDRVYRARDLSIDREALHITLNDGTIAFSEDVLGRVTGAFFEGEGEVLLMPPSRVERGSMALFTGATILEQTFSTAYFRFNDNTFDQLRALLSPAEGGSDFVAKWDNTAVNLAQADALRLLITFSNFLSSPGTALKRDAQAEQLISNRDRMLSVRLQNAGLGAFDVHYDSSSPEQIWAGQPKTLDGEIFYNLWTSFSTKPTSRGSGGLREIAESDENAMSDAAPEGGRDDMVDISSYTIKAQIRPPTELDADVTMQLQVKKSGERALLFELSRSLHLKQVEADDSPVEFIQNSALEGTELARRGNDLVAVIFPKPLDASQRIHLRFLYGGSVITKAGEGLLYVGARGLWYPNRGLAMSNFDIEFHYPPGWTLLATGKQQKQDRPNSGENVSPSASPQSEQVSRWVSERPIPLAGFNLGRFSHASAQAGDVEVTAYASSEVEHGFPIANEQVQQPELLVPPAMRSPPTHITPPQPSPARNEKLVAERSAKAIKVFSEWYGPYPYAALSVTQVPGVLSQGWPSLIYLSTFSFLTAEEKEQLKINKVKTILSDAVVAHETAHQWWGDSVTWSNYHDQWILEALADYSSLLLLESENPAQFRAVMASYRDDLLEKNRAGRPVLEAGPITLGARLSSSQFPNGYQVISYERGVWLLHMLRCMMNDQDRKVLTHAQADKRGGLSDEPFFKALRKLRTKYEGGPVTTAELVHGFEEFMPRSVQYNGRTSLDWFYSGWINETAIPRFEISGVKYAPKNGGTQITGSILQKSAPQDLITSVPLYAQIAGKNVYLGRVFADGPETQFRLAAPVGARKVIVDPNQTLLSRSR